MPELREGGMEQKQPPIDIKDFNKKSTNNFYLYFFPGEQCDDAYRTKEHYLRFSSADPERAQKLLTAFNVLKNQESAVFSKTSPADFLDKIAQNEAERTKIFDENKEDLYEAYLFIRRYAKSDEELFS